MNNFRPTPPPATRLVVLLGLALGLAPAAFAQSILGSTSVYALMAGSTLTNNGEITIIGDLGAANIAGAGTLNLTGNQVVPITAQNLTDFYKAYNGLAAMTPTVELTGMILGTTVGAITLTPGVYHFDSTAQLTGTLTLDAQNQANAVWVFQVGSTFTSAASSSVVFVNQVAGSVEAYGLFWQVGSTVVAGANSLLEGNFLTGTTISFGEGGVIGHGRALSGNTSTITLSGNTIDFIAADSGYIGGLTYDGGGNVISSVPEPSTYALFAGMAVLGVALYRRKRSVARTPTP